MQFLIQTVDDRIVHDFSFALIESIKYQNWYNNDNNMEYKLSDVVPSKQNDDNWYDLPDLIPVGTVEFVSQYLKDFFGKTPLPINVPHQLMIDKFTGRNIINGTEKDIIGKKFIKSNDIIKAPVIGMIESCSGPLSGNYQISDEIDIQSEWRAFVHHRKLVGLNNYSANNGRFDSFPYVPQILSMIDAYTECPPAYTLDVAVGKETGTVVIEVHDFFSCGLYGFADHRKLPFMFNDWFRWFTKEKING